MAALCERHCDCPWSPADRATFLVQETHPCLKDHPAGSAGGFEQRVRKIGDILKPVEKGRLTMRTRFLLAAALTLAAPALAATPATTTAKPKPCPRGQVLLTSKITGDRYCAALGGVSVVGGGAQPVLLPKKPARKTRP
jgi:hypothetical protein